MINRSNSVAIEQVRIDALKLDASNPRVHPDRQIRQIARSIRSFGFLVPPLIDRAGNVVAGHGRILAAKSIGLETIPILRAEALTAAQVKAFRVADNRLAENSAWDDRLLADVLKELSSAELDFSLEDTGFSLGEIDLRIEATSVPAQAQLDPVDELPAHSEQAPVSTPGTLWILGRHRLQCGSALETASYRSLMQGKLARLVFTDPPYNTKISGHVSGKGRIKHREFAMASGEMTGGQFAHFLSTALGHMASHIANGSLAFACIDWRHAHALLDAGTRVFNELKNLCVWVKGNAGMGSLYRSQHELVFVFKKGTASHRNNVELGVHGRNRTNVWQYASPAGFGMAGEEGRLLALHPTVKPVAMIADAILDASARGDIVLDPFIGSGSTIIAAERVGRACYGMDLDPLYVDTAIRRWQRHTGEHAIHAESGKRFDTYKRPGSSHGKKAV